MSKDDPYQVVSGKGRTQCCGVNRNGARGRCNGNIPNKRIVRGLLGFESEAVCNVCELKYPPPPDFKRSSGKGAGKGKGGNGSGEKLKKENEALRAQLAKLRKEKPQVAHGSSGGPASAEEPDTSPSSSEAKELDGKIAGLVSCIKTLKALPTEGRGHLPLAFGDFDSCLASKEGELQAARAAARSLKPVGAQLQQCRSHLKRLDGYLQKGQDAELACQAAMEKAQKSLQEQKEKNAALCMEVTAHKAHIARLELEVDPNDVGLDDKPEGDADSSVAGFRKFISGLDSQKLSSLSEAQRSVLSQAVNVLDAVAERFPNGDGGGSTAGSEAEFAMDVEGPEGCLFLDSVAKSSMGLDEAEEVPEEQREQFDKVRTNLVKSKHTLGKQVVRLHTSSSKVRKTIQ